MLKYSIIMPVYNAENYIEENLKIFNNINRKDIELVIINDGSDDKSLEIIEKYNNKDNNIVLINQSNHGVSYSRNIGIEKSNGKYITFLDCDDKLEQNLFKEIDKIYNEDYDFIRYGLLEIAKDKIHQNKVVQEKQVYNDFKNSREKIEYIYTTNKMNAACNQITKSEILKKNNIKYNTNHKYAEDFELNKKIANHSNKVCFLPDCLYNYNINDSSTSRRETKDNVMKCILDAIDVHTQSYKECKQNYIEIKEKCFKNVSLELMTVIRRLFFIKKIKIKEIYSILKELQNIENVKLLIREKKENDWKSNLFIDNCLYEEPNYFKLMFYKIYFKFKRYLKRIFIL